MAADTPRPTGPLRVWIDAQLPPSLAKWLAKAHGVTASHVVDEGLLHADDAAIFEAARDAGITALLTKDDDFVRLLEERGSPPQIAWVTIGNTRNAELRRIVLEAWSEAAALLVAGEPLVEIGRRSDFFDGPSSSG
jgi:predicted nuclease of predicted toxin-antitoxin system